MAARAAFSQRFSSRAPSVVSDTAFLRRSFASGSRTTRPHGLEVVQHADQILGVEPDTTTEAYLGDGLEVADGGEHHVMPHLQPLGGQRVGDKGPTTGGGSAQQPAGERADLGERSSAECGTGCFGHAGSLAKSRWTSQ